MCWIQHSGKEWGILHWHPDMLGKFLEADEAESCRHALAPFRHGGLDGARKTASWSPASTRQSADSAVREVATDTWTQQHAKIGQVSTTNRSRQMQTDADRYLLSTTQKSSFNPTSSGAGFRLLRLSRKSVGEGPVYAASGMGWWSSLGRVGGFGFGSLTELDAARKPGQQPAMAVEESGGEREGAREEDEGGMEGRRERALVRLGVGGDWVLGTGQDGREQGPC
ncbi:hypothetical protein BKA65DRAFT_477059 [Rhexocercosporidium sp. MPI-PUGE-AT-0058]|nr:hypothetical protein BKA65DRAFT_477059 [Rhexocercosporidium sp. MPI-PUGE-AT-0058]